MRNQLIDLIAAYGEAVAKLGEARTLNSAAMLTAKLMKAQLDIVNFVDKHYELKQQ